jgi:hypothetical protein
MEVAEMAADEQDHEKLILPGNKFGFPMVNQHTF